MLWHCFLFCFVFCAPVTLLAWRRSSVIAVFHFSLSICSPVHELGEFDKNPPFCYFVSWYLVPFLFLFHCKNIKNKIFKKSSIIHRFSWLLYLLLSTRSQLQVWISPAEMWAAAQEPFITCCYSSRVKLNLAPVYVARELLRETAQKETGQQVNSKVFPSPLGNLTAWMCCSSKALSLDIYKQSINE